MDAQDRTSNGWQVWLTPRQPRIIYDALARHDPTTEKDSVAWRKLQEWFVTEAEVQRKREKSIIDLS